MSSREHNYNNRTTQPRLLVNSAEENAEGSSGVAIGPGLWAKNSAPKGNIFP